MLARPCSGKGGGKGMFTGGEGTGAFSVEREFSRAGWIETSAGDEWEASWVAKPSVIGPATRG